MPTCPDAKNEVRQAQKKHQNTSKLHPAVCMAAAEDVRVLQKAKAPIGVFEAHERNHAHVAHRCEAGLQKLAHNAHGLVEPPKTGDVVSKEARAREIQELDNPASLP